MNNDDTFGESVHTVEQMLQDNFDSVSTFHMVLSPERVAAITALLFEVRG